MKVEDVSFRKGDVVAALEILGKGEIDIEMMRQRYTGMQSIQGGRGESQRNQHVPSLKCISAGLAHHSFIRLLKRD